MTILPTLIALNFFGVFEITGGSLTGVALLDWVVAMGGAAPLPTVFWRPSWRPPARLLSLGTALDLAFTQPPTGILLMLPPSE